MSDRNEQKAPDENEGKIPAKRNGSVRKSPAGKGNLFRRWENPADNRTSNDVSSEIKAANSGGTREGGKDKRRHMENEE